MPVPCQTPCEMCGDVDCICKLSNVHLLKDCDTKIDLDNLRNVKLLSQGEVEKFLREHPRSDFDFKSAVLNALKGDEKK